MSDAEFHGIDDISELLVPQAQVKREEIEDGFDYNVGFHFAFAGVGQCGGRIAQTFYQLGYRRICAINTTIADMRPLELPDGCKLDVGEAQGAGKDPKIAKALFDGRDEDIYDLFARTWGDQVDYAFVCLASAGGTGAGGFPKVAEVARRFMVDKRRSVRVGAIVSLPTDDEGQRFAMNCLHTMRSLVKAGLSPVIFIDNQKIRDLYHPGTEDEHARENNMTAMNLHMFNQLSGTDSAHTTFDRQDLAKLLDSGVITFASASIDKWDSGPDISTPIRERLRGNVLATVDVSKADLAGLIYVLYGDAAKVKSEYLGHGTSMFTRMLADKSTVLPGIYPGRGGRAHILVMAMIGNLPWPKERITQLGIRAGVGKDVVGKMLGV